MMDTDSSKGMMGGGSSSAKSSEVLMGIQGGESKHPKQLQDGINVLLGAGVSPEKAADITSVLLDQVGFEPRRQYAGIMLGSSTAEVNMLAGKQAASMNKDKKNQASDNTKGAFHSGGFSLSSISLALFGGSSGFGSSSSDGGFCGL